MRVVVLIVMSFALFGCNKTDKADVATDDVYGEYETPGTEPQRRSGPTTHVVEIVQMKFVPEVLNVSHGDTVVWVNKDMVQHDVTELNTNLWTSSRMVTGASWKMVFSKSQVYHCSLHVVMKGKVVVDGNDIAMVSPSRITMCGSATEVIRTVALN